MPRERRFWFYPSFHPTNSVLLHRQADDILRADFQLGRDADPEEEKKPENVDRRLRQMFGPVWVEGVREIVSAEYAQVKFIVSDGGLDEGDDDDASNDKKNDGVQP